MKTVRFRLTLLSCFFSLVATAQQKMYTPANAHAHNDYVHPVPFYSAFNAGFGSIEADVFPVNGMLCVAHSKVEIQLQHTLKSLYLDPLLTELKKNKSRRVKLLIDIKEDYPLCLQLLQKELEPLTQYLSTLQENKQLIILVSGKRPVPPEYAKYPGYVFFDDDLTLNHNAVEWKRIGQVSLSFSKYSSWNGENTDEPAEEEKERLKQVIDSVHLAGKTIRFWAAPDNEASWIFQMKLGVDLVGTDKINEFSTFLRNRSK